METSSSVDRPGRPLRLAWHYVAIVGLSLALGLLYIQEPGFGDELTYWGLAFNLHEQGGSAWGDNFHALRWPIWGLIWLWQTVFGVGLGSYYFVPLLFLALAGVLVFAFGRLLFGSPGKAWMGVLAVLFSPLLDVVVNRPMPDLPESVYGGTAVLAWWGMMQAQSRRRILGLGILSGLCIGFAFANRVSGIFITPVLGVGTAVFFRGQWKRLLLPAAVSALFVVAEGGVYYLICHDWLHSVHANLGGTGAKDVEVMRAWQLPLRYLGGFLHGNRLSAWYSLLAVWGLWAGWKHWGRAGRLVVLWFGVLYLEYSCMVQSIHPVRPLMGGTLRYLAVFSVPVALLVGMGVADLLRRLSQAPYAWLKWPAVQGRQRPVLAGVLALGVLVAASNRPRFDLGYLKEIRVHLASLPRGTKIFSHHAMYELACLADARAAHDMVWTAPHQIMERTPELEREAAAADEFWYLRKMLWLNERRNAGRNEGDAGPEMGTYLAHPEEHWILAAALKDDEGTDIVIQRRRPPNMPPAHRLSLNDGMAAPILPSLPVTWQRIGGKTLLKRSWPVPPAVRGKLIRAEITGRSNAVEAMSIDLHFLGSHRRRQDSPLHPIFHRGVGYDFFAISVPADAETCEVEMKFKSGTEFVELDKLSISYDDVR